MDGLLGTLRDKTNYLAEFDQDRVISALRMAEKAHQGMRRVSGEPFITHPVAVAALLADMQLDSDTLIAGLLHDTVEDTSVTFEEIEEAFGQDVRRIVEGETKISKLAVRAYEDEQAENLRKMLLAMAEDVRIILVKLADRLHNMRTLAVMPTSTQLRIARETLEIFVPLAHRLGIGHIKSELEDLSFTYADPEKALSLRRMVTTRHAEREEYVASSIDLLQRRLGAEGLNFEIGGRSKHLYSIYRKMDQDNKNLDQIFDLMAVRVIIEPHGAVDVEYEEAACYRALGIVHNLWTPIPGRFKDYVAVPKTNGYQSLHTTVIAQLGQPLEVQIRTRRMHRVAEYGVAAHWAYKEGLDDAGEIRRRLDWMEQLLDLDVQEESAGGFLETVKTDLLSERVFVFTPAGDVINLPKGSTPLDFAYQVHTEVGHRCIGSRVNGEIVPLNYQVRTGDRVEILTNRSSQNGPSADWLNVVVTRSAKQKIRTYFRQQEKKGQLESGRRSLERGLRRRQLAVSQYVTRGRLEEAAKLLLGSDSAEDLFLAVANRKLLSKEVIECLVPGLAESKKTKSALSKPIKRGVNGILVDGMDAPAKLAQCCSPVRGDEVVGYVTRGRGVSVHRFDCSSVKRLMTNDQGRLANVTWDAPSGEVFPADFEIIAVDRPGLLKDILHIVASMNKSATRVSADVQDALSARIHFRVDVKDLSEIEFIKDNVQRVPDVTRIYRAKPGVKG